jgi:MoxR-like ATPase
LAVETVAASVRGSFVRIQFTPDLVPSDIVGSTIFNSTRDVFEVALGPVFANFVLADEVNRAPAKVQSALLEVMSEQQVTINGVTYPTPRPFFVLATQNPIESEGVYPLPEAQRDRSLMKVLVEYPTPTEELEIINRVGVNPPSTNSVIDTADLLALQRAADEVFIHHHIREYIVRLVYATREPEAFDLEGIQGLIAFGAGPRASLGLVRSARALALLRGRDYVLPHDVSDLALDVLRHRIVLSFDAIADGVVIETVLERIVSGTAPPDITPAQSHERESVGDAQ